jgi:hypothetical protein
MMVSGERSQMLCVKAKKDLLQAAALLAYLLENDLKTLRQQWANTHKRRPAWRQSLKIGAKALEKTFPELCLTQAMPLNP